jgi:hypothetical protein
MSDPALPAMDTIFNDVCVLVAAAFALTLVPSFRQPKRSFLSRRDQGAALLVFTILGLVEEATASHAGVAKRANRGGMRGRSGSGSLGGTGRLRVCHLVSRRAPRPAVRLYRNFHVVRWFGRRVAVPLAPKAGATPNNVILSDIGGNLAPRWPHFPLRS